MPYVNEHIQLRDLKARLAHEYLTLSMPISDDKAVEAWLRPLDFRLVRIIDPIPLGMHTVDHLVGKQGVVWLGFEVGGFPRDQDVWYFHREDRDLAMLFKLTWVV